MRPYADTLDPPISDDSGYLARARDLAFLRITPGGLADWRTSVAPLGMSRGDYVLFCTGLAAAAAQDEIETLDARLKGSSAKFFSGVHKTLPAAEAEWAAVFLSEYLQAPTRDELHTIRALWHAWIADTDVPLRRPFDSLFRLTVSPWPSDYDVQLSSDDILQKVKDLDEEESTELFHPRYDFINKDLIELSCPSIVHWSERESDRLNRGVSVAAFDGKGPRDKSLSQGALSAHFRTDDWTVPLDGSPGANVR